jgi:hypothetical protein
VDEYERVRSWWRGGYSDRRGVNWITAFPRDSFSSQALKGITVNLAFFQVRSEIFLAELADKLGIGKG